MSFDDTFNFTTKLLAFAMLLQAVELLFLTKKKAFFEIWSFENLKDDLKQGLPFLPMKMISAIFSENSFLKTLLLQILISFTVFFRPDSYFIVLLIFTHLVICIRFRGTFNGGSDMMTFVVLTGTLMASLGYKAGFIYIGIHTLYSYFKAGTAKIRHSEWRQGVALPAFIKGSLFTDVRSLNVSGKILSWSVILFEIVVIVLVLKPQLTIYYFFIAVIFHLVNYYVLGLNRFLWIWLSAWPAIFYLTGLSFN